MVKSKKFLELLKFGYLNFDWEYVIAEDGEIWFFSCRHFDTDNNVVNIVIDCDTIVVKVNTHEIYRMSDAESNHTVNYIFNKLAAAYCGNLDDYDLDGFMWGLLFEPNCCDCEYQNDCEAWDEFYQTLEADHRKQRGRTAPNRALCGMKADHRKQRGRTAPNAKLNIEFEYNHKKRRGGSGE